MTHSEDEALLTELGDILSTLLDGTITPEQEARLAEILRRSQSAKTYYHDYLDTHEDIGFHLNGGESDLSEVLAQVNAIQKPASQPTIKRYILPLIAIAAAITIAFVIVRPEEPTITNPPPQTTLAILADSADAIFAQDMAAGASFSTEPITLKEGTISISFNKGAQTIIRGPARFTVLNTNAMHLDEGLVYATVPSSAVGFRVDTPTGSIIDLSTEFGIQVRPNGTVETHVTKGAVRALTLDETQAIHLTAGEARSIHPDSPNDIRPIAFAGERFPRTVPTSQRLGIPDGIRWVLTPNDKGLVYARRSDQSVAYTGTLMPNADTGPQWQLSEVGSALYFDGKNDYLQTDYLGIGEGKARTVTFWAKTPPQNGGKNNVVPMVSWGSFDRDGGVWQISWNNNPKDGEIGGLRIGAWRGQVVGRTDLRDDRWHHLAVVMNGADMASGISLYLDGKLEQITLENVKIKTLLLENMRIGRSIDGNHFYRGWLADVHVFEGALTADQIAEAAKSRRAIER